MMPFLFILLEVILCQGPNPLKLIHAYFFKFFIKSSLCRAFNP